MNLRPLGYEFHPRGGRFHVKPYPKGKLSRRFELSAPMAARIAILVEERTSARRTCCSPSPFRNRHPGSSRCRVKS
jgi:hypothetical protein